ncbi:MAG: PocR ligand-binding domain-containing protein [Pseudomonadota bacterium]
MSGKEPPRHPSGDALFVRPPRVEAMRDPKGADWHAAIVGAAASDDLTSMIDFGLMDAIFENFLDVIGLPIAIIDLYGRVLASSRWQRICMDYHRADRRTLARCLESDTSLAQDMAAGKTYAIYRCRNGLTDCATPIVVEDVHVANLFVGQFLLAPPDPETFDRQREEFGFDPEGYAEALAEVPIVAEEKLPAILRLMGGLAQQIGRQSLAEHRIRAAYEAVERQVAERTHELAASRDRLRKIAGQVPGVVFQFKRRADGGFCVPYVSDAFIDLFGIRPEEVREDAAKVFAATHTDDLDRLLESIRRSADTLSPWNDEFRVVRDGVARWVGGAANPQAEPDGAVLWHGFITDVTERKRADMLTDARLRLAAVSGRVSLHDLLVATLDEACALSGAVIGFYHFLLPDQRTLALQAWSSRTTAEFCTASAESNHYDVDEAGVWADAVRQGCSVVYNDYAALSGRKGLPAGHAPVLRLMSVPILRDGRIAAVIGVGNKPTAFDDGDLRAVETLADLAWDLAERKRAEEELAERNALVQRRYESLRALNEIAALPPGDIDDQLGKALTLGARHLGLDIGIVSRIEGDQYRVEQCRAPEGAGLSAGMVFPLGATYCAITLAADDVLAIPHVGRSEHAAHPCYQATGLEAYIAAPLTVRGRRFGTVNFSSAHPSERPFDEGDVEFMRLLARWVGSMIERGQAETEVLAAKEAAEAHARELALSNGDLEQFAYVASHDLRQPLRMVNSYLALIERRYADLLDDDGREFIGFARGGAQQMDRLIRDLLEYSRVGRHGEGREALDLAELAAEAAGQLSLLAEETDATLEIETAPAPVEGTRSELVRLLQNLIGNALKYRAPGRPPKVSVGWRRQAGTWEVWVADNGIGISPEYHDEVFKIFRRLHAGQDYEGTGIGLAVCQKIVTRHGGRIWLESEPGAGSTFRFILPAMDS